jgi:uncharacterized protein
MSSTATQIVSQILSNPYEIDKVRPLVSPDFTYVSLNYQNDDLKSIMPWCGTSKGVESLVKTFVDVRRFWTIDAFSVEAAFGEGENVAVFGRFTYTSTVMKRTVTSPFAVFAKVVDGRCSYMQFMEDSLATSASFKKGGLWTFHSDPSGGEVTF